VDLETLDTQSLLDPDDKSLEFVRKRKKSRPMAIYRSGMSSCCATTVGPLITTVIVSFDVTGQNSHFMSTKMDGDHAKSS